MIDKLQAHYGFTRMPFGRDLAPGMLHRHAAHNEACGPPSPGASANARSA